MKFLHIVSILFFVLVVSGCTASVKVWPPQNIADCDNFDDKPSETFSKTKDHCYAYFADQNNDVTLCEKIIDSLVKDECLSDVAINTLNSDFCSDIINYYYKDTCYKTVSEKSGISSCGEISDFELRNSCFYMVAVTHLNPDLCESVDTEHAIIDRDRCYYEIGKETRDIELCNKVVSTFAQQGCIDFINNS